MGLPCCASMASSSTALLICATRPREQWKPQKSQKSYRVRPARARPSVPNLLHGQRRPTLPSSSSSCTLCSLHRTRRGVVYKLTREILRIFVLTRFREFAAPGGGLCGDGPAYRNVRKSLAAEESSDEMQAFAVLGVDGQTLRRSLQQLSIRGDDNLS